MNSEIMMALAANAIEEFGQHNDSACVLYIRDGLVCCCSTREATFKSPTCLIFSRLNQKVGLTSAGWDCVSTALFNLYTKELACQARQKP